MSIESAALQQLIKEVAEHRNTTEQELDAVADILQKFAKRLMYLEAAVDKMEKEKKPVENNPVTAKQE